jgi:hypothetical protein
MCPVQNVTYVSGRSHSGTFSRSNRENKAENKGSDTGSWRFLGGFVASHPGRQSSVPCVSPLPPAAQRNRDDSDILNRRRAPFR